MTSSCYLKGLNKTCWILLSFSTTHTQPSSLQQNISRMKLHFWIHGLKLIKITKSILIFTQNPLTHKNYLSYSSCHPRHCKTGCPYGELLRIKRNCTRNDDFVKNSAKRLTDYAKRGYPMNLLLTAFDKASAQDRNDLVNPTKQTRSSDNRVVMVMPYNPANSNVMKIIWKHWHLLQLSKN